MNRSFRAQQETAMQAAVLKQRQQLRPSIMKEKEEDLALFLEMRKREKEQNRLLLNHSSEDFDAPLGSKHGTSPIFNLSPSTATPVRKTVAAADDFLNSDSDKNDYDWLLTPPGTPLFPSLEMESQKTVMSQIGIPKARPTALKSRLANPQPESAARGNLALNQPALSSGSNSTGTRRPSSSGCPGSRPATPTGRPTLSASKPARSSTPTSRSTLQSTKPSISASKPATKPLTSSTKPTVSAAKTPCPATKPTVSARSSTPTRSTTRSSTPTSRPSIPSSKPASRAATPTRRTSTPSSTPIKSVSPIKASSSVTKLAPAAFRNSVPSRGASLTVASRPWKPSEMPGFSLDAPPNLRTTLPDRPLSATRGRPGAPSSRSSSVEPGSISRPRRQSCSPSRGRLPNGNMHISGSSVPAVSRGYSKVSDNVSPVIGTKMVERVVNMRKLAPPKPDDKHSLHINSSAKSESPDSSGFGRTLSKKSLDMAIRHMDIRRSIPGNLRPLMTNIPASSMYSVRCGCTRSKTISVSDSPLATSSNGSSEVSIYNNGNGNGNGNCLDGSEVEDDIGCERVGGSPTSVHGR
ncbi:Basic Proline-rich Protein 1 [Hibiscus trionum]|uniref:Basic Proline-rich Protein 1 n=1 Tax=Hibiscus trionum TaxID=183268 RepID=A0A9W7H4C3_HIBTR|nr:Basic Proline-rich Protein 1 [Hibiscus trionum]